MTCRVLMFLILMCLEFWKNSIFWIFPAPEVPPGDRMLEHHAMGYPRKTNAQIMKKRENPTDRRQEKNFTVLALQTTGAFAGPREEARTTAGIGRTGRGVGSRRRRARTTPPHQHQHPPVFAFSLSTEEDEERFLARPVVFGDGDGEREKKVHTTGSSSRQRVSVCTIRGFVAMASRRQDEKMEAPGRRQQAEGQVASPPLRRREHFRAGRRTRRRVSSCSDMFYAGWLAVCLTALLPVLCLGQDEDSIDRTEDGTARGPNSILASKAEVGANLHVICIDPRYTEKDTWN